MVLTPSTYNDFYMSPNAVVFTLNALGDKDTLSVSVFANAKIAVYKKGVVDYNPDNNYRQWTLVGYNTYFEDTVARYCHIAVAKTGDMATLVYPSSKLDVFGRPITDDGEAFLGAEEAEDPDYYYLYIGKISSSSTGYRTWEEIPVSGNLDTDRYRNEEVSGALDRMFQINELNNTISQIIPFAKLLIGIAKKAITDVWRSEDTGSPTDPDTTVPTLGYTEANYLSKNHEDTAQERINFNKGLTSRGDAEFGAFVKDSSGAAVYQDDENNWHVEADYFKVRKKLTAEEVAIMRTSHIGGKLMNTAASCKIAFVVPADDLSSYTCYFEREDGDGNIVYNYWVAGDQAYCQTFNLIDEDGYFENQFYWRLIIGVGYRDYNGKKYNYVVLSNKEADDSFPGRGYIEGSTEPKAGDEIVQLGNRFDATRANAIIQSAVSDDSVSAPYFRMYNGIRHFTLPKPKVSMSPDKVSIVADELSLTTDGDDVDVRELTEGVKERVDKLGKDMEGSFEVWQIDTDAELDEDGNIVAPDLSSYPSSEWGDEDNPYSEHVGDFMLTKDGICFMFEVTDDYQFVWTLVTDKYLIDAVTKIYETQQGLLQTGIDITKKEITITADNTIIRSRTGKVISMFTETDGKPLMRAEFVDVDNLKVKHLDGATGTFSGELEAASGTFKGKLVAASGSFEGGVVTKFKSLTELVDSGDFYLANGDFLNLDSDGISGTTYKIKLQPVGYDMNGARFTIANSYIRQTRVPAHWTEIHFDEPRLVVGLGAMYSKEVVSGQEQYQRVCLADTIKFYGGCVEFVGKIVVNSVDEVPRVIWVLVSNTASRCEIFSSSHIDENLINEKDVPKDQL